MTKLQTVQFIHPPTTKSSKVRFQHHEAKLTLEGNSVRIEDKSGSVFYSPLHNVAFWVEQSAPPPAPPEKPAEKSTKKGS